jgi:PAS domain S-box-containing protein
MQTSYKRFSVIAGFAVLLVVLLTNGWVTRRQLGVQVRDQYWVQRTHDVMVELYGTQSVLVDAETGQRGFLYTGDPKYLEPYQLAIGEVDSHIDRYAALTADSPEEQADIPRLRSLVHAKLDELAQTISLYQAGRQDEAKALVLSDNGLVLMNEIRGLVAEMSGQETALQAQRMERYKHSVRVTVFCIYLASGLAALGLLLLGYFILRQMELRERHGAELREREEWFRVTLTSIGDAVIATDDKGRVTFLNPVAEELLGRGLSAAQGRPVEEVFPIFNESTGKPVENPVKKVMELGLIVGLANHTVLERTDGTLTPIEDSAAPIRDSRNRIVGVVLVFRDATQDRKSQELVRKSEKLAAAARFAATVAHEINNPLEAVTNLLYLAQLSNELDATKGFVQMAERELRRVSVIANQTLRFYKQSTSPLEISASQLFDSVLSLLQSRVVNFRIQVEWRDRAAEAVRCFEGEIRQVLSNLIGNAIDAMQRQSGRLLLRSRVGTDWASQRQGIFITIADTGEGIAYADRSRLFEPFYTTKGMHGTGLGLWVSSDIVRRHNGVLRFRSIQKPGRSGTVFTLFLPFDAVTR